MHFIPFTVLYRLIEKINHFTLEQVIKPEKETFVTKKTKSNK